MVIDTLRLNVRTLLNLFSETHILTKKGEKKKEHKRVMQFDVGCFRWLIYGKDFNDRLLKCEYVNGN